MTVSRLINLFSSFGFVPIEVDEVAAQIVEWGYYNQIVISPFDGPSGHLRGNILVYENLHCYSTATTHCVIRFNSNCPPEWQRLICVKELIHCLDPDRLKINSRARGERFLDDFSVTGDVRIGMGLPAILEEVATYQALGVLCPDLALDKFREKNYSEDAIVARLDIPLIFVKDIMDPNWPDQRDKFSSVSE